MARETRKLKRSGGPGAGDGKAGKKRGMDAAAPAPVDIPDPLSPENLKSMGVRLGLPILGGWVVGGSIAGFSQSETVQGFAIGIPAVLTVGLVGVALWALRQARKVKGVAGLLSGLETAEDRKAAIEKLDANYKGDDPTALFAKAQLLMQEDPEQALAVLERIKLERVMANVADEARSQRAMIHLMLGQVTRARDLADGIDISRHQDVRTKAMMSAVIGEAWARTGQAKKAVETVELFNPDDAELEQLRPQMHRARAYVYAHTNDLKGMRRSMRKLLEQDHRLLGGFLGKRTHPMLAKEARKLLERSGQVPRKMQIQRRP